MTGIEYQLLAMRTNDRKQGDRLLTSVIKEKEYNVPTLLYGSLGLAGEAGEVLEIVKKGIFHEKGIDKTHIKKELGDVLWYVALICDACRFNLDDVLEENISKLKKRYPDGFDTEKANHRDKDDI